MPIDSTDIIRSVPVICRVLHFPLNINLNAVPKLIQNNAQDTLDYLNFTNSLRHFSFSILKTLIEDRRTAHDKRIHYTKNLVLLKAVDIIMARTAIQSNLSKNKVAKSSYSVRGPYQILRNTGLGKYFVQKLNKLDNSELKFMDHDLIPFLRPLNRVSQSIQQMRTI